jgi:ABC-type multidrug transport system fused ATPase/permease subunit
MTISDYDHARRQAVPADTITASDATLFRIDTVIGLLLSARLSASSILGATSSEHERQQAALVSEALDDALMEQRVLRVERYRDVTRAEALTRSGGTAFRSRWVHRTQWQLGRRTVTATRVHLSASRVMLPGLAAAIIYLAVAIATGSSVFASIVGAIAVAAIAFAIGMVFRAVFLRRLSHHRERHERAAFDVRSCG